jgi:iron-sulfur cluster repair protein YtfE (RIC family)
MSTDPIDDLVHDHGELNRRVLDLGAHVRRAPSTDQLVEPLADLRDHLFHHFAREEESLFPFVAENISALAAQIHTMEVAHDTICGALARMVHLAQGGASLDAIVQLFDRFETAYATHARAESELLSDLPAHLDDDHRAALAALVRGL